MKQMYFFKKTISFNVLALCIRNKNSFIELSPGGGRGVEVTSKTQILAFGNALVILKAKCFHYLKFIDTNFL